MGWKKFQKKAGKEVKWDKLDNTANIFPVIASESMTNVYRFSSVLKENIREDYLQEALEKVLPMFSVFSVRLRAGLFWYYFEGNDKEAPRVTKEAGYPCEFLERDRNNNYLFRVTYFKNRINLEVFHVLTDGSGALQFLRELIYHYLRISHKELMEALGDRLSKDTSLNTEDSYVKNYRKRHKRNYKSQKAVHIKGELFPPRVLGVLQGHLNLNEVKNAAKSRGLTVNQLLVGVYTYAIYMEYLHGMKGAKPVSIGVPVNLRPFFGSNTTKNFFIFVNSIFLPERDDMDMDEVFTIIKESLKQQITPENLRDTLNYNVSNEKNLMLRMIPLFLKKAAMKRVYNISAKATTSTMSNMGQVYITKEYQPYIEGFHCMLAMSEGQNIKGAVCTYNDSMVVSFTSVLKDLSIQRKFFKILSEMGVKVLIETNGVYY